MIWSLRTLPFKVYVFDALEVGSLSSKLVSLLRLGGNGGGEVAGLEGYSGEVNPGDICCKKKYMFSSLI
jgi:hypothetical protein